MLIWISTDVSKCQRTKLLQHTVFGELSLTIFDLQKHAFCTIQANFLPVVLETRET